MFKSRIGVRSHSIHTTRRRMIQTITARTIRAELEALAHPAKAKTMAGFFKTGPGEYGEGGRILGRNRAAAAQAGSKASCPSR